MRTPAHRLGLDDGGEGWARQRDAFNGPAPVRTICCSRVLTRFFRNKCSFLQVVVYGVLCADFAETFIIAAYASKVEAGGNHNASSSVLYIFLAWNVESLLANMVDVYARRSCYNIRATLRIA